MKKNQPEKTTPLRSFKERHDFLSFQTLSDICAGEPNCSRSQMARLVGGGISDAKIESEMRRSLAARLPEFLLSRGWKASRIDAELSAIFTAKGEYKFMIEDRISLKKPAQKHFGLTDDPFPLAPKNRTDVFISDDVKRMLNTAIDAIVTRRFVCILGEIGIGKTILKKLIIDKVAADGSMQLITPETFDMSKLSASAIARDMLEDLGEYKIPRSTVKQTKKLRQILERTNLHVCLLLDECHRINRDLIPVFKNIYEMLSHGFSQDCGIILIGQPQFKTTLTEMPEIKKRLEIIEMPEFQPNALAYLRHQLALVGGNADTLFDERALEILQYNAETPLSLGNAANRALNLAHRFTEKTVFGSSLTATEGFAQVPEQAKVLKKRSVA